MEQDDGEAWSKVELMLMAGYYLSNQLAMVKVSEAREQAELVAALAVVVQSLTDTMRELKRMCPGLLEAAADRLADAGEAQAPLDMGRWPQLGEFLEAQSAAAGN